MKRFIVAVSILIFFLVLLGLLLAKIFLPSKQAADTNTQNQNPFADSTVVSQPVQTNSPATTAKNCFAWYVQARYTGASRKSLEEQSQAVQCFTPTFISSWNSSNEETDADPVLTVMELYPSWGTTITTQTVGQSIRSNDERVQLGAGEELLQLQVHLVQQLDGSWEIDGVTKAI